MNNTEVIIEMEELFKRAGLSEKEELEICIDYAHRYFKLLENKNVKI